MERRTRAKTLYRPRSFSPLNHKVRVSVSKVLFQSIGTCVAWSAHFVSEEAKKAQRTIIPVPKKEVHLLQFRQPNKDDVNMTKTPFGKKKRTDAAAAGESPRALSAVSKLYDVDGDGVLNDAERALRELDTENEGRLSNQKVLQIMQQQLALQHQLFSMKRILIGLLAFTVLLALSNLGTAFAAASLAKDTSVSQPQSMNDDVAPTLQDKGTHTDLATISKGISIKASTVKMDSRRSLRSSGAHRRAQGVSICPAGYTYQPLMGCFVNPRLAGKPCLISTTGSTQCAAGLECREADFTTDVNTNTGRCVNPNQGSNGYNIITIGEETSGSGAESGTEDGGEGSEMKNTNTTNAGGNADNSTEPAVPIDDEIVPTVASDNVVPGVAVTDDSVINYVSSFNAQRAWVACLKSTSVTFEHVCFDTDSISNLGCENSSRQPTAAGPVYKFDNNVILDCSTGEAEGCRATGLKCSFANRLVDGGSDNGQDPATPVKPATVSPLPPCPANPTQKNMGTNEGANAQNSCSRSCECIDGCCIARPYRQFSVCLPNAPNDFVSCMSV